MNLSALRADAGVPHGTARASLSVLEARAHRGLPPGLFSYRDRSGVEVDLVVDLARSYLAVETKAGQTVAEDFFAGLRAFPAVAGADGLGKMVESHVVYGGGDRQRRFAATVLPWSAIDTQR